jgi:hypothetical protein
MTRKRVLAVVIVMLLTSSLACSLSDLSARTVITLEPVSGTKWDDASMQVALEVVAKRLATNRLVGSTVLILPNGRLQVTLTGHPDLTSITPLVTEMGMLVFYDAKEPPATGDQLSEPIKPILTNADINTVTVLKDAAVPDKYMITITLTPAGANKLEDYTQNNLGHYLVIARDGIVIETPIVNNVISGGQAVIQGNFTYESANALASMLESGALPFPLVIVNVQTK